mgnify:CR=1 FL=1
MCVACDVKAAESGKAQEVTVCPDAVQIRMDYPLSWVSRISVTTLREPYGTPLFTGRPGTPEFNLFAQVPGTYTALATIGLESGGTTNCALVIPYDGSAPFVRVYMKRPDFYV